MSRSGLATHREPAVLAGVLISLSLALPCGVPAVPSDPRAALTEVQQLIEKGEYTTARNRVLQALKKFPNESALYNFLGVVEVQSGDYRAAEADFRKAIDLAPQFTGAYLNLGRLLQEHADQIPRAPKKALEAYQRLLKHEPGNVEANYQSAYLLQLQGSYPSSLEHLARLPADVQGRAQALAVRCADYAGLNDRARTESAEEELARSADLTEAEVVSILPTLEKNQRPDLAIKLFAALAGRNLASVSALYRLGLLYERHGELKLARETLEKVGQQQPSSVPLLVELGRIADRQGDHKGALGYLAHALDLDPQNASVHFFFGMVCVKEDLAEEAYRSLKKATALDPNNPYYDYAFASVAMTRQDANESIIYFRKYVEPKPDDPRGRFALGASYFYNHNDELAPR